jgi:hypothetical protein
VISWSDRVKAIVFAVLALLVAMPASAQVGHEPDKSPYVDLEYKQEFTPYGGYVRARKDAAGVLPKSASVAGLRYELFLGGPVSLTTDFSGMFSQRDIIDPKQIATKRLVGTESAPVYALDVGLAMGLTGRKSWHRIVPQVRGGVGVVHSAAKDDSSGYSFGTPFAFTFGGGLKLVPGGRFQLRADVGERLFKQKNPDSFYVKASDNTAVLTDNPRSYWTHHTLLTVGVSILFDR